MGALSIGLYLIAMFLIVGTLCLVFWPLGILVAVLMLYKMPW